MYELLCCIGEFFKFRVCRHGNVLSRDSVRANICISGTASLRKNTTSWKTDFGTRRRRGRHQHSPTCSWSWSFTVCSASYIKRTRPHPYHVQKVQGLEPADCPRCVIYCKWLLQQCRERPNFLKCILFTDSLAILFSTVTRLLRSTISTTVFHKSVGRY